MSPFRWEVLGGVSPRQLAEARLLLHHAVQLVAAVGRALVPPAPDDGHTSLEWLPSAGCLAGRPVPGPQPWRAALRLDEPALVILSDGTTAAHVALAGLTRLEAFSWLLHVAEDLGGAAERLQLDAPYEVPEHAVGSGVPFPGAGRPALAEVARWVANADALLRETAGAWPGAAPVRVWPHHFDIGSVLPLTAGRGEHDPSIGIGLSPGDDAVAEPYLYVTPWPPPGPGPLPELPAGGRWNRERWTGALLTGSEIVSAGGGEAQATRASAFLSGAIEALRPRSERRGS
jgi:hypothetical protein